MHKAGWQVRSAPATPTLHAKIWLFGEDYAVIGSHNVTEAAMSRNIETSLVTEVRPIIVRLHLFYSDLWVRSHPMIGE